MRYVKRAINQVACLLMVVLAVPAIGLLLGICWLEEWSRTE